MVSPLHIEIAIWYATRGPELGNFKPESDAGHAAHQHLVAAGLLDEIVDPQVFGCRLYCATDGLHAWVNALTKVPLPVRRWTIPTTIE